MNRRGFLGSILALGAAPAVVKAESLMRLWVPPQDIVIGVDLAGGQSFTSICIETLYRSDGAKMMAESINREWGTSIVAVYTSYQREKSRVVQRVFNALDLYAPLPPMLR